MKGIGERALYGGSEDRTGGGSGLSAAQAAGLVERLLAFARTQLGLEPLDGIYVRNALLSLFELAEPAEPVELADGSLPAESANAPVRADSIADAPAIAGQSASGGPGASGQSTSAIAAAPETSVPSLPSEWLEPLLDYAHRIGVLEDNTVTSRDLLDARIMGMLMPRPSDVARAFRRTAERDSIRQATSDFYKLCIQGNYIRADRIAHNVYWRSPTPYGELEITINLSKPEKDPREIAKLKNAPARSYPKCLLCLENLGYAGRVDHPARQNLRVIPVTLDGEPWYFQYSPYLYYNEHAIVFSRRHEPMTIGPASFRRLLDFLDRFPHYFIGSNADLPIVGGSILNHEHYQGGRHVFPMEVAPVVRSFRHPAWPDVQAAIVRWPMSVVRLASPDRDALLAAASHLLARWRTYSDESAEIRAATGDTPHNTITPIARMNAAGHYEMDLVLRNNRTDERYPDGIFHPHPEHHHIKRENIGLIEVMGLAILPGRLVDELETIAKGLSGGTPDCVEALTEPGSPSFKHAEWLKELVARHGCGLSEDQARVVIREETGHKFLRVLENAGVFKAAEAGQEAFRRFLAEAGFEEGA